MTGPRALRALGADGLLRTFGDAGVLTVADVHVATRLGVLAGEADERVLLAVALVVRGTRLGSVVLDLTDAAQTITPDAEDIASVKAPELPWPEVADWVAACASSRLVAPAPGGPPLRMAGARLWLARYWQQEAQVAEDLLRRGADRPNDIDEVRLEADLAELFSTSEGRAGDRARDADGVGDRAQNADGLRDGPGDRARDADGIDEADQRAAVDVAVRARLSVIAGGPGTGKTTTIARLIAVLRRQHPELRIALAAPTGKAAARLTEAVHSAAGPLSAGDRAGLAALSASTLHRLLGRRPGVTSRFWHDRTNRLPYDVVVVDECSMVSLTLMARLLEALGPATRLVLVGDPDQLASVEAGAVLGDLVDPADVPSTSERSPAQQQVGVPQAGPAASDSTAPTASAPDAEAPASESRLRQSVAVLRTVHRFDAGGAIATLAQHVRAGRADEALAMLLEGSPGVDFHAVSDDEPIAGAALAALQAQTVHEVAVIEAARAGDVRGALSALDRHRLLCAHRTGPRGVQHWSNAIERWLAADDPALTPRLDGRYAGQPLLVTANDYENGLYNGDTGVVVQRGVVQPGSGAPSDGSPAAAGGDVGSDLVAAFKRGGEPIVVPLVRLSDVRALHAMTVHRAQGSQFDEVTVLLPLANSPLATRQTFYTAITRATSAVRVIGSEDAVLACVQRQTARATGLCDRLAGQLEG